MYMHCDVYVCMYNNVHGLTHSLNYSTRIVLYAVCKKKEARWEYRIQYTCAPTNNEANVCLFGRPSSHVRIQIRIRMRKKQQLNVIIITSTTLYFVFCRFLLLLTFTRIPYKMFEFYTFICAYVCNTMYPCHVQQMYSLHTCKWS